MMNNVLSLDDRKKAFEFALKFWENKKDGRDFCRDDLQRPLTKKLADVAMGKLGELAFQNFLRSLFGIEIELDFDIYVNRADDGRDIKNVKQIVNIKSVRYNARSLLLYPSQCTSDLYICSRLNLPSNYKQSLKWLKNDVEFDISGFIDHDNLMKKCEYRKKGDNIPGTSTKILAREGNNCLCINLLNTDWEDFINQLEFMA